MLKTFARTLPLGILAYALTSVAQVPAGTKVIFQGSDSSGHGACHLFILDAQESPSGITAIQVQTGYQHGHDAAPPITAGLVSGRPDVFSGTAPNGQDQIAIFLGTPGDIKSIQSFNLKWMHGNHFHTHQCLNMQIMTN